MNTTQTKNAPNLRFSEFSGDWQQRLLEDLVVFKNGKAHEQNIVENGKYIVINSKFISSEGAVKKFSDKQICPVFKDEITMVMSDIPDGKAIAKCFLVDQDNVYTLNQRIGGMVAKASVSDPKFLLNTINRNKYYLKFDDGVSQTNLRKDQILHLPIVLPVYKEQQKIADFLTAVDGKILALAKKIELLKKYKKGVMQKIFSQEIRFKDENGKDFPDWEEQTIADVAYSETSPLSANKIEGKTGKYKVYGASGVIQTLDTYDYKDEYIAIVKDGAGVGRISFCEAKSSVLGTMVVVQPKNEIDKKFLYYLLSLVDFNEYTTGSTIPHVYFKQYSKQKFFIPRYKEQEKIADFLTSFDQKIEAEEKKFEKAKKFKKFLLQNMFV